jgi:hypothetical protein
MKTYEGVVVHRHTFLISALDGSDKFMHRRKDYIKMDLQEVGYEGEGQIHLAQDRDQW